VGGWGGGWAQDGQGTLEELTLAAIFDAQFLHKARNRRSEVRSWLLIGNT